MARRSRLWWVAASIFSVFNFGGAGAAIMLGEGMHALTHVGLGILGGLAAWGLASRTQRPDVQQSQLTEARLEQLQQSVDAIAIEVERIGEAQRFSAKLRQAPTEAQQ